MASDKPNAAERWQRWQELNEDAPDPSNTDWAIRGDGAVLLQDDYGWFAMLRDQNDVIVAQSADPNDPDQNLHPVYCEPIWLAWAYDQLKEEVYPDE
jgi:hypothetical protein